MSAHEPGCAIPKSVTVQRWVRPGRADRFAYAIAFMDGGLFVSHYRYASEAAALAAGHRDANG